MQKSNRTLLTCSIFSKEYWKEAAKELTRTDTLIFAALIVALRVIVKLFKIPVVNGVSFTFDAYVNSLGSLVYGPLVGLLAGAVSDTIGCIVAPNGVYFFPFIFVEMTSSFLFGLFFWRRKISIPKALCAKFLVNLICNIIMTSTFMKWEYYLLGDDQFYSYNIINATRIVKNLVLFPLEAVLIAMILTALLPALKQLKVIPKDQEALKLRKFDLVLVVFFLMLSVGLILFYMFFLKNWVAAHNVKWL